MESILQTLQQQQQQEQQQQQQELVSYNVDYFLFNEFNKRTSLYAYYKMTPNDFNTLSESNKKLMVQKYYDEMKFNLFSNQVDLPLQNRNLQITRDRSLFNNGNANESLTLSLNNDNVVSKKTKRYFNVEPIFQTDGGFDLTIDKINVPDRTLFFGNDVMQSHSEKDKKDFFYLNSIILGQTIEIEDKDEKLDENESFILVPVFDENKKCLTKKVKAITSKYGEENIRFYDFGYDKEKYPSQSLKKEIPSMISTTIYSIFKKSFSNGLIDPEKPLQLYYFILPMTNRKDLHNLNNGSIHLRVAHIPIDEVRKYNGGKDFNPLDLASADEDTLVKARNVIDKMMKYVNNTCDNALERNITTKNYKCVSQPNDVKGGNQSLFSKNKKIKLSYN